MVKRNILFVLYYFNIFYILFIISVICFAFLTQNFELFHYDVVSQIETIGALFVLIFWLYNLYIWIKSDKKLHNILFLLFLNWIYSPFYFRKALRNHWV